MDNEKDLLILQLQNQIDKLDKDLDKHDRSIQVLFYILVLLIIAVVAFGVYYYHELLPLVSDLQKLHSAFW